MFSTYFSTPQKDNKYHSFFLNTKNISTHVESENGEFVKIKMIEEDFTLDKLGDEHTIIDDLIYIKDKTSKLPLFYAFKFEDDSSAEESIIKKYGRHISGIDKYNAVQAALNDECIEYLKFARLNNYPFCGVEISSHLDDYFKTLSDRTHKNYVEKDEKTNIICTLISDGKLESVKFLHEKLNYELPDFCTMYAIKSKNLDMYIYLKKEGCRLPMTGEDFNRYVLSHIGAYGLLDMLKYFHIVGKREIPYNFLLGSAINGHNVHILKYYNDNIQKLSSLKYPPNGNASGNPLNSYLSNKSYVDNESFECLEYIRSVI